MRIDDEDEALLAAKAKGTRLNSEADGTHEKGPISARSQSCEPRPPTRFSLATLIAFVLTVGVLLGANIMHRNF